MGIQYLDWDTNFFGIKIGRVELNEKSSFDPLVFRERALDEKYELIYVFKYGAMVDWGSAIKAEIELMDIMLTMSMKFDKRKYLNLSYTLCNELQPSELNDCYRIAEQIADVSRFNKESKVGSVKAKKLYKTWLDNALNQSFADGVFVAKHEDVIAGIHIISTDAARRIGKCSVIGADSNFKGLGLGKNLWSQAFGYWAKENKIETCQVPFSILNNESFNFHLKIGFNKVEEVKYIYHFRNNY